MKDRSDDPSHHGATARSQFYKCLVYNVYSYYNTPSYQTPRSVSVLQRSKSHNGARYSSVVRAFAHGAMGRRIDLSWGGPIELFLVPASAPRLV